MSAQLVDPFAPVVPPLTPAELSEIRRGIYADPMHFDDPGCIPDMFKRAVDVLGRKALAGDEEAAQTLRDLQVRAESGIPFGEPQEPAWSLDPDPRVPKRGE